MKVVLSPRARNDLHAIKSYIAKDNPRAADEVVQELLRQTSRLEKRQWIGRAYEGEDRRVLSVPRYSYLIFFDIDPDHQTVEILTYWHMSRLPPDL